MSHLKIKSNGVHKFIEGIHKKNCEQVSHVLTAVRFSCLLWDRRTSFQDVVAAGEGFLCIPFWGVQICDYSAA
jgi:hypothetical protein